MHTVTLIPGDGIGPEVTAAAVEVIAAAGIKINWEIADMGITALEKYGTPLPDEAIASVKKNKFALKGPVTTPVGKGFRSVNVGLRQALNLYANLRPVKSFPGIPSPFSSVDLVVVRENTEDLYAGVEHNIGNVAAEAVKIITKEASNRIARFAFQYALEHRRKKVTAVHKANILKLSDGLFLNTCQAAARDYPDIEFSDRIIDALCMDLVLAPHKYDVLVLPNLYGDIVSDLCAGLVGGLGLVPGANIGTEGAVFEAVHGSAPDIAGKGIANPTALMLCAAMLLDQLGETTAAEKIRRGIEQVIEEKIALTRDLGGSSSTREFTEAICRAIV
ncbi:MAG: isocitrate/isopropylmalate dehydrogenase family protein [Bacillota bacterium]|uniref:NAD-dependent isocitrate dehydrogenase n=1 Tax=Thermanaerosceptrum fracticalcis TaxID=1712410 RepID=A0A7G6E7I1_THEFR|nr:isocitrate/isopropylmalate dehydrogenase family protein [Thermanaerosceptrum fracticalcis]QNB48035.1 NAD-dependent isocitrate dehydrogenase [Thermanaerosceptrum fracticalcis]